MPTPWRPARELARGRLPGSADPGSAGPPSRRHRVLAGWTAQPPRRVPARAPRARPPGGRRPAGPGRRRVPGLRREELALLAGVSADYYVRLEQGRDKHPSEQVIDALPGRCTLDDDAIAHLHELARPAPRRRRARRARSGCARSCCGCWRRGRTPPRWCRPPPGRPGRQRARRGAHHGAVARGPNMVRCDLPGPGRARHLPRLGRGRADTVAACARRVGTDLDDPRLTDLVGELSLKSDEFRRLWARHDVRGKTTGPSASSTRWSAS